MKKLYVAVLAIAALAACNKEEVSFVQSNKKAVDITIANAMEVSRAVTTPTDDKVASVPYEGTIETQATDKYAAAQAGQLVVLFANSANIVEQAYAIEGGKTTRYHNVNESVTQVAIVRSVESATKGEDGAWTYKYNLAATEEDAASFLGTNLNTYLDAAKVQYTDGRGVDGMDLFVVEGLGESTKTCKEANRDAAGHVTEYEYALYEVSLHVAPLLARVEVTRVACDGSNSSIGEGDEATAPNALGATTLAAFKGKPVSGGYDELKLGTLTFDGYTYDFNDFVLKGIYDKGVGEREATHFEPGAGKAIVWNIATETAFPLTTLDAMTIDMVASAYDYTVVNDQKNLTIGFDNVTPQEFEPGKIYRLAINFGENNLDASNEAICVDVTVTVQEWVVVPVTPVFGN